MSTPSARKRYFCFLSAALLLGGYFATAQRLMGATQAVPLAGHGDPVAPILLALVLIALGAALGGRAMSRLGQPVARLGERSEEHTAELQSLAYLVFRLLL